MDLMEPNRVTFGIAQPRLPRANDVVGLQVTNGLETQDNVYTPEIRCWIWPREVILGMKAVRSSGLSSFK